MSVYAISEARIGCTFFSTSDQEINTFLKGCIEGNQNKVITWIRGGNSLSVTDGQGRTALMFAAVCPSDAVFNMVLQNTPYNIIQARDRFGFTASKYASLVNRPDRIGALINSISNRVEKRPGRRDVLEDPEVIKATVTYFENHRPSTVRQAQDYVKQTYGYECTNTAMARFLRWCSGERKNHPAWDAPSLRSEIDYILHNA